MAVKVKVQRDYLRTESSVEASANISQVDEIMKASKTNGKMVVLYNEGHVQGINIEQNTKIPEAKTGKVREILEVKDEEL